METRYDQVGGDPNVIAHHEAGHAVACFIYNLAIFHCSIVREGDVDGCVSFAIKETFASTAQSRGRANVKAAIMSAAGPAAEALYYELNGIEGPSLFCENLFSPGDYEIFKVASHVRKRRNGIWNADADHIITAKGLVRLHWPAVTALAKVLLDRKTIGGAECVTILKRHIPVKYSAAGFAHAA